MTPACPQHGHQTSIPILEEVSPYPEVKHLTSGTLGGRHKAPSCQPASPNAPALPFFIISKIDVFIFIEG